MAFDMYIIKKVYQQMPDRVDQARKIVGRPLTLSEKYYTTIFGIRKISKAFERVKIMLTSLPTELHVKMQLHKWHFCNLCKLEKRKLLYQPQCIVII